MLDCTFGMKQSCPSLQLMSLLEGLKRFVIYSFRDKVTLMHKIARIFVLPQREAARRLSLVFITGRASAKRGGADRPMGWNLHQYP